MIKVNYYLDLNNNINGKDLEELSLSKNYKDRVFVAQHTNTYARTLEKLSKDEDMVVRYNCLKNSNISKKLLNKMLIEELNKDFKEEIKRLLKC